jgi:hypothetical protein
VTCQRQLGSCSGCQAPQRTARMGGVRGKLARSATGIESAPSPMDSSTSLRPLSVSTKRPCMGPLCPRLPRRRYRSRAALHAGSERILRSAAASSSPAGKASSVGGSGGLGAGGGAGGSGGAGAGIGSGALSGFAGGSSPQAERPTRRPQRATV